MLPRDFSTFTPRRLMSFTPLNLPDFLPGRLILTKGCRADYRELEQFHYLPGRPATWAAVWTIRYLPPESGPFWTQSQTVAVGVLSYPTPRSLLRERYFNRQCCSQAENLAFANANLRTISRIIVHPQFRSLGLSTILVRCLCLHCPTRYVEAFARMARAHPFFDRAGMKRIRPARPHQPVYFIFDRNCPVL